MKAAQGGIAKIIVDTLFSQKTNILVKKHKLLVRKILKKLMRRCGVNYVNKLMPECHRPMIAYLEREKRKKLNKKQKDRLLALMGNEPEKDTLQDGDEAGSSDESSDEELDNSLKASPEEGTDSEAGDSDNDSDADGGDRLPTRAADIPRVDDIPIVSQLAKRTEKQRLEEMDPREQLEFKVEKNRDTLKAAFGNEQLETHFVENPFIKSRERISRKQMGSKVQIGEDHLKDSGQDADMGGDAQDRDIYIVQESGKIVVKDLEKDQADKETRRQKRRQEGYGADSDTDSDEEQGGRGPSKAKGQSAQQLRKLMRKLNKDQAASTAVQRSRASTAITKRKSPL